MGPRTLMACSAHQWKIPGLDVQLFHGRRKPQFPVKTFQTGNAFPDEGIRLPEGTLHTHHLHGELREHSLVFGGNILHPCRGDDGQARAVVHVIQGAQFVLHGVAAPVLFTAHAQQVVMGEVAGKRNLRPGVVIVQVPVQDAGVFS